MSATLDLTEFPETVYRINIHYVDVHITRNVRFHKFSGNSYSDFLSFIGCSHYSYDQFVSGPLKLLHRISKTLYGIWKSFFANFCTSAFKILLLLKTEVQMCILAKMLGLITFEEFCHLILAYLIHTYLHKPRQISTIIYPSEKSYADYGSCLETMMHTMLFTRFPQIYINIYNQSYVFTRT